MKKTEKQNINNSKIKNPVFEAILEYIDDFNIKFSETKERMAYE